MALSPEMWFAYRFPYSATARELLRSTRLDWNRLPPELVQSAFKQLLLLFSKSARPSDVAPPAESALLFIQSFALSKILLSYANEPGWFDAFGKNQFDRTLFFLQADKKPEAIALQLLEDHKVVFERNPEGDFLIPVPVFLSVARNDEFTRLVNQRIEKGRVYISLNHLQRWLGQNALVKTRSGLPVETRDFPASLEKLGRDISRRLKSHRQKVLEDESPLLTGPVRADAFPPCMNDLFSKLNAGENLPHLARFDLATFLIAIGMPAEAVVNAFARAPNFSEKITRYQVERIGKLKLSAPSCAKVREHGFCPLGDCSNKHPVSYYGKAIAAATRPKKDENAPTDA